MKTAGVAAKLNPVSCFFLMLIFSLAAQPLLSEEPVTNGEEAVSAEESFHAEETWNIEDYDDPFIFYAPEFIIEVPPFQIRSFDEIFPDVAPSEKTDVMGGSVLIHSFEKDKTPLLFPDPNSRIDLLSGVMQKDPTHIIEALVVIPYNEKEFDILDIYNALGRIEKLKLQTFTGTSIPVFRDTTRIDNAQRRTAVSDPLPSDTLPFSETMYLRITDRTIGNIFLRGDISLSMHGITYHFTNFADISFLIFRIMRAEMISIVIYLEPVEEGILIYSVSGLQLPSLFLNSINLASNIDSRVAALLNWITEGLEREDEITADQEEEPLSP